MPGAALNRYAVRTAKGMLRKVRDSGTGSALASRVSSAASCAESGEERPSMESSGTGTTAPRTKAMDQSGGGAPLLARWIVARGHSMHSSPTHVVLVSDAICALSSVPFRAWSSTWASRSARRLKRTVSGSALSTYWGKTTHAAEGVSPRTRSTVPAAGSQAGSAAGEESAEAGTDSAGADAATGLRGVGCGLFSQALVAAKAIKAVAVTIRGAQQTIERIREVLHGRSMISARSAWNHMQTECNQRSGLGPPEKTRRICSASPA